MADRVIVLSRRPARIKSIHAITFRAAAMTAPAASPAREASESGGYFNTVWEELEVRGNNQNMASANSGPSPQYRAWLAAIAARRPASS